MKDSNDAVLGLKVAACTGNKLDFFNKEAAAAASYTGPVGDAAAAAAAYDYSRLILSTTYKDDVNIIAFKKEAAAAASAADATAAAAAASYASLILSDDINIDEINIKVLVLAANLLTIMGQPTFANTDADRNAYYAVLNHYRDFATNDNAIWTGKHAGGVYNNYRYSKSGIESIALAAVYADVYAKGLSLTSYDDTVNNANYKKVMAISNSNPGNLKPVYITGAGLIYQSVYEKINKAYIYVGIMALIAAADFLTFIGQPDIKYNDSRIKTASATASAAASAAAQNDPMAKAAAAAAANITRNISLFYNSWGVLELDNDGSAGKAGTNAAKAAGYADAYAKGQTVDDNTVTSNANYLLIKVGAGGRLTSNMVFEYNLKAKFIQAAGLIYKSVYEKINKL
jgi:hypothetical protein